MKEKNPSPNSVSITEAARINNVTRQAIYVAIETKRLKAHKGSKKWWINLDDLEDYRRNKYSRAKSMFKGNLLFDNEKGLYSISQAAKTLEVPKDRIYYLIYRKKIKFSSKGAAYVLHIDDIQAFKNTNKESSRFL